MDFEEMSEVAYRGLNADAYAERRSKVLSLAENLPEDATEEQMRSIDAEVSIIAKEDARRDTLAKVKESKRSAVAGGSSMAKVITSTKEAAGEHEEKRGMSIGERAFAEIKKRGVDKSDRFTVSGLHVRANTDTIARPASGTDYYGDTLEQVDDEIREGYRREMTIQSLFSSEVTEKDAVSFYVEGAFEGNPGMIAEGGKYAQVSVAKPQKKTNSLVKLGAFWKETDELLTDAPRFATHVNNRVDYEMDIKWEDQLVNGDGTGNNLTGLLYTDGLLTDTYSAINLDFIDSLLDKATTIKTATPNFMVDALLLSQVDFNAIMKLKDENKQYILGGPTNIVYGNGVNIARKLWDSITIVGSPAMPANTMVLGAFKRGGTIITHEEGRMFEFSNSNEDDFTHGLVTFRTSQRGTLAIEYPAAFMKLTKSA